MFISTDYLATQYGVHETIADFFVERESPTNNLYWKDKLLYLRPQPGYLFIPVIVDTLYKLGIDKNILLSDVFINLLEQIGHIAALEETNQLTKEEGIEQCILLTKDKVINKNFYATLTDYMKGGSNNFIHEMLYPFSALHRGDIFLFSVTVLDFDDEVAKKIVAYWFAIISSFLMLDDAQDVEIDKKTGDENAFLQCGLDKEGIERIKNILGQNLTTLKIFNKPLARTIDNQFVKMATLPHIQQYLNY